MTRTASNPRLEIVVGVTALVLFFGGFGGWAATARLDAAVYAPGVVVVSGNRQAVQHRDGGIVTRLAVGNGDVVAQGQVLIELDAAALDAQRRSLFSQIAQLEATRARLEAERLGSPDIRAPAFFAELDGEDAAEAARALEAEALQMAIRSDALATEKDVLAKRQEQLARQIVGYRLQERSQDAQAGLIKEEIVGMRTLNEKGFAPITRLRALERTLAALEGQGGEYAAMAARAEVEIGEARTEILSLDRQRAEDVAEEMRQSALRLGDLHPRLAAVETELEQTRLRAPTDGVVVGLSVHTVGGVVRAGETLMEIVPQDRDLLLEVRVRPEDADDLVPGLETEVKITAFPQRDMPILDGRIVRVSADRFEDERSGQGFFLAEVEVPAGELASVSTPSGAPLELMPGLPVEVVVPLRSRTALEYAVEPLQQALWRSFREH